MDRNRDVRRGGGAMGMKEIVSDDEERTEEEDATERRIWERSKKEKANSAHVGPPSSKSQQKRKHSRLNPIQRPHHSSKITEEAVAVIVEEDTTIEETKILALENGESRPQLLPQRLGKSRVQMKGDEFVMDIPYIPRKARSSMSSSSRFTTISRRDDESLLTDNSRRRKSPLTVQSSQNGGDSSPNLRQEPGRRPGDCGSLTISDQEAEVAEALFVLASGMASQVETMGPKAKAQARGDSFPSKQSSTVVSATIHNSGKHSTADHSSPHAKEAAGPIAEALKRKRLRAAKQEEKRGSYTPIQSTSTFDNPSQLRKTSVGGTEPDSVVEKIHDLSADSATNESKTIESIAESYLETPSNEELKIQSLRKQGEAKIPKLESCRDDQFENQLSDSSMKKSMEANNFMKQELLNKASDMVHNHESIVECKLVVSSGKLFPAEENAPISEKQSTDVPVKSNCTEETSAKQEALKDAVSDSGLTKLEETAGRGMQEQKQEATTQMHERFRSEKLGSARVREREGGEGKEKEKENEKVKEKEKETIKEKEKETIKEKEKETIKEKEKKSTKNAPNFQNCETAVSSNVPVSSHADSMSGLPYLEYYKSGAMLWAGGVLLPNPNLDLKTTHPTMKVKRCATHVYLAHYIHREQQISRHSLWSAAFCRSTPYNMNMSHVSMFDNEKLGGAYVDIMAKAPKQQREPSSYGYTLDQDAPSELVSASTAGISTLIGNATNGHTQYMQAMMQTNGFASFPFPFNGVPGQAAQFFNAPFFPPHLMPPISQLPPLPQQGSNAPPTQKQQIGSNLGQSISSQMSMPQRQVHRSPNSPSQSQQPQILLGSSSHHVGAHSEKDSNTVGVESVSTAESRLQKTVSSNLPNLNACPTSSILASDVPDMLPHDQGVSLTASSMRNQAGKSQYLFEGHNPALSSGSMQQKHFASQNIKQMSLGITSLTGSPEISRFHLQEQHAYGASSQQYQRNLSKNPSVNDQSYSLKERDYCVDKKAGTKQVGRSTHLSRPDMEASSVSIQGFPNRLGGALSVRVPAKEELSSNSGTCLEIGQGSLLQNQPSKQDIDCAKGVQGATIFTRPNAHIVLERNLLFSGPTTPTSNQGVKQSNSTAAKGMPKIPSGKAVQPPVLVSSTLSKREAQLAHINLGGVSSTPLRGVTQSSVNVSMINKQLSPISKSGISTTSSKSPATGKGNLSSTNSVPSLAGMSLPVNNGQGMPVKAPVEQKKQSTLQMNSGLAMPVKASMEQRMQSTLQLQQESGNEVQSPQIGNKNRVYTHPQQQIVYKPPFQQQESPQKSQSFLQQHSQQHSPLPVVHHYQPSSQGSHGYAHYPVSNPPASLDKNAMAFNALNWSALSGLSVGAEIAEQCKGSGPQSSCSENRMADMLAKGATLPVVSGQVKSGSHSTPHFVQLASKAMDDANKELNNVRYLSSSSPPQPAMLANSAPS